MMDMNHSDKTVLQVSRKHIYFRVNKDGMSYHLFKLAQTDIEESLNNVGIDWTQVIGIKKHSCTMQELWYKIKKDDGHLLNLINDDLIDIIPDEALDNIGYDR